MTIIRKVIAQADIRVSDQALRSAETFAVESFSPDAYGAMIFKLVNRDTTLALRCGSAFKKEFKPATTVRRDAVQLLEFCRQRGWRIAFANALTDEENMVLDRAGVLSLVDFKGPPAGSRVSLPDTRVLGFIFGNLGITSPDCIFVGTRLDNNIRPGNNLRMTTVHLQVGMHGMKQLPRDLRDVADWEAPDTQALFDVLNRIP